MSSNLSAMETEDNMSDTEHDLSMETNEEDNTFQIDRNAIKAIDVSNVDGLADIEGLSCYDEQTFELGCIQQLEQHIYTDTDQGVSNLNVFNEEETEQEVSIRLGEITPFGSGLENKLNACKETFREKKIKNIKKKNKKYVKEEVGTSTQERIHWRSKPAPLPGEEITIDFEEPSGSEYEPTDNELCQSDEDSEYDYKPVVKKMKTKPKTEDEYDDDFEYSSDEDKKRKKKLKDCDDGDEASYQRRLRQWEKSRADGGHFDGFHNFDFFGFKIPQEIWEKLFKYQKVGVQWLYELNETPCGGILGDEMGMGKTIQIISFLAAVHVSKIKNKHTGISGLGPSMIVCPVTVMHQWVSEFHKWYPPIRVAVLHGTGSFEGSRLQLIKEMIHCNGVLITSYSSLVQYLETLMITKWHYVILDEGHTIRNPDAQVTLAAKCLRTPHRIILTGSPMQNKLQELWSLFDFVFPGKLGTLPMFMEYYGDAILQGGFATASEAQVLAGYKCAKTLKEIITPFMLRRMKKDVMDHLQLPNKSEQVLFCKLTDEQINHYKSYINSGDVNDILSGRLKVFVGLIKLRKICNHPDLFSGGPKLFKGDKEENLPPEERFGFWGKAGKMIVLSTLLKMWNKQKHRVLLFTQSKQMLGIFELFMREGNYKYLKMDGTTNIGSRQSLVNKFNTDSSYFVMLLTTKVGGFGINLTGADRVVIYDPDWNPATDIQARERAWRIGQEKQVTVYRLITAGTIEEKMYHRQIFKQFLANRVLNDPKQRRFFKANDLMELFTLQDQKTENTETSAIFAGTDSEIKLEKRKKINHFDLKPKCLKSHKSKKKHRGKEQDQSEKPASIGFSKEKIEAMKRLAQRINEKFQTKKPSTVTSGSLGQLQVIENNSATTAIISRPESDGDDQLSLTVNRHEETKTKLNDHIKFEISKELGKDESFFDIAPQKTTIMLSDKTNSVYLKTIIKSPESNRSLTSSSILKDPSSPNDKEVEPTCSRSLNSTKSDTYHSTHHKKKKKKKSKGDRDILNEKHIPHLVGKEKAKKEKTEDEVRKKQDDYILQTLFSKSNICTAMKHDKIMEEGGSDYVVIENEAEEIAKKAIEAIKTSRRSCHNAADGIPTWTGSNGSFKVPTLLLEKIKKRKEAMSNRQQGPSSSELFANKNKLANSETVLIEQIIDFVSSSGNRVTSALMVEKFRNVNNAALFKALLNAVCNLKSDSKKLKYWTLKEEFQQ